MQPRSVRFRHVAGFVALLIAAAPVTVRAQGATGRIAGTVTDAGSGQPITDVRVTVEGADRGAVTDAGGRYLITDVPVGARRVRVRKIGYAAATTDVTVAAGQQVTADFRLRVAATQLTEVIVTGTPGAQERRTIGNAVSTIDVADVTSKTTLTTVSDVLQGRTPGVSVMSGSGSPGTSTEITVRGYGSFTNNRPVIYIDGVRMDTDDIGAWNPSGAGTGGFTGQRTSALDQINPQDIESIEVIKGPAAATLYGADAAAGVIQIITKKGLRGQQRLRWTTRYEYGHNEWGTETLTNYTQCTQARIDARDGAGNITWPGCQGLAANAVITDDPLRRDPLALRKGPVNNQTLSLRGGGDRYSFYLSGDNLSNQGVFENSFDRRRGGRANFTFNPNNRGEFTINMGYTRQSLRLPLGDEAGNGLLLSAARGIPGLRRGADTTLIGWGTIQPSLAHRYNNSARTDRFIIGSTINYSPLSWWRNRLTLGLDLRHTNAQILSLPGDPDIPAGLNAIRSPKAYNYTLDYAGTVTRPWRDFEFQTSFGSQILSRRDETVTATGSGLPTREVTIIGAALNVSGANSYSEFNQLGFFGQQQIGWKNRVYFTTAVRGDDASSFGTNFDWIVYPKASLSWVLSEEPRLSRWMDMIRAENFRLRAAWGRAGRAPTPYSAVQTYSSGRVALSTSAVGGALFASSIGNPNLKPEKGEEIELGFESDYFDGRFGIDFTFYRKVMKDLFAPLALPPSVGFPGTMLQNLGQTTNRGAEVAFSGTPLSGRRFTWDARLNMSWNKNRLDALDTIRTCMNFDSPATCPTGKSLAEEIIGGASYSPGMQRNRVGFPLGSYFLRFPLKTASGADSLIVASGVLRPVYDTTFQYVGPAVPTRLVSLSNTVTLFRNWRVYVLLDHQGGHWLYNQKSYNRCATVANGPNCPELNDPALVGTPRMDTLRAIFGTGVSVPLTLSQPMVQSLYTERADFIKLRDVSLTYTLPTAWARRFRTETASLTLTGRNLAMWTDYSGLDPEVNGYSNNQIRGAGNAAQFVRADTYTWPMLKRYSVQVNLTY